MKDIYNTLAEKQKELERLQREIDALRMAVRILGSEEDTLVAEAAQSQPQMIAAILEASGKPMHVKQLAEQIKRKFKRTVKKTNLGVLLYRYAQRGRRFYKVPGKPNTYGLIKWQALRDQQGESRVVQ